MTLNLHQVDAKLWRSGQPLTEDWRSLWEQGIRTVLKLNDPATGSYDHLQVIDVFRIHITDEEAQTSLRDPSVLDRIDQSVDAYVQRSGALLVHCTEGKDRTGIAIARYRVRRCGWTKQAAWDEWVAMGSHGYRGLVDAWNAWEPIVR